jgi:hypothetical protein
MNILKWIGIAMILVITIGSCVIINQVGWFAGESVKVAKQELHPQELLRKYEWFKDSCAVLDKKNQDIKNYVAKISSLRGDYEGVARKDWDRTDKETLSLWNQELIGVKGSYNSLAAEYNSQMSKINWRFTNIGMLPEGQTETMPREYRTYQ